MQKTKVNPFLIAGLFAMLILCTNTAQGQYYSDEPTFFGGFILGTNFAQIDGDNFTGYHKIGLNGGAVVHTRLMEKSTISMSLLFSEKGSFGKSVPEVSRYNQSFTIKEYSILLQTAEIPLDLNFFLKDKKSMISTGLSYSQLVNATAFLNGEATDEKYPFKKYDIALNLGFSYRLYKRFHLNLRFQNSLMNIRKLHDPNVERPEQFNRSIALRLMYLITPRQD